jgi:Asp-tRNA(Asn)/Glu-tRNA(Gln) amidotransferase C subunit
MNHRDKIAHRLALLEGVSLSPAELEAVVSEIEDFERIVGELEEFGLDTAWISLQAQPTGKKV